MNSAPAARLLVVDDDAAMRQLLMELLQKEGYDVDEASTARGAIARVRKHDYDLVLSDILMPGESGLELMFKLRQLRNRTPVVLMTAFGSGEMAEHALGFGAFDYLEKPLDLREVRSVVRRALSRPKAPTSPGVAAGAVAALPSADLVGEGAAMRRLFDLLHKVAGNEGSVLIWGESGTGKELVAHSLHDMSPRKAHPLVPVNCSAIPEGLLESEIFGHVRGAFTGATSDQRGLFEQANHGTLFLDEIGDMELDLQARLLRVLQDHEIRPVGSNRTVHVDVRILAATNKDLAAEVKAGRFREDLFYRLDVIRVRIPPLRERTEDIPALARVFIRRHAGGRPRSFSSGALRRLQAYDWPGNARELENLVQRVFLLSDADVIGEEALRAEGIPRELEREEVHDLATLARRRVPLAELTSLYIEEMLSVTGGRRGEAARRLGVDRKTLYRRRTRGPQPRPN